ncbi:MAG: hypothetical protein HY335_04720 [Deinococcus sp.]|nr:hypothetical protein [Deinococcus sp.]
MRRLLVLLLALAAALMVFAPAEAAGRTFTNTFVFTGKLSEFQPDAEGRFTLAHTGTGDLPGQLTVIERGILRSSLPLAGDSQYEFQLTTNHGRMVTLTGAGPWATTSETEGYFWFRGFQGTFSMNAESVTSTITVTFPRILTRSRGR